MSLRSSKVWACQAFVIAFSFACSLNSALALDGSWYVGVGAGALKSHTAIGKFSRPAIACNCVADVDDSSTSLSIFGGYEFNQYVGLEAGVADLPDSYNVRLVVTSDPQPSYSDIRQDSRSYFLRAVFRLPIRDLAPSQPILQDVSLAAVLGVQRWRSETSLDANLLGRRSDFRWASSQRDSGTGLTFGARINYDFTEAVRIGAAWDRYTDLGASGAALPGAAVAGTTLATLRANQVSTVEEDVDVFSLNLIYRFR